MTLALARSLALSAALAASFPSLAQVVVTDPWVRGTVAAQSATGAFMQLKSTTDVALVAASSTVAGIVEIHEMKMDAGVMRMSAVRRLDLAAQQVVELKPGGYHVMLMALKQKPLAEGSSVPLTLTFEDKAGKRFDVKVDAQVRPLTASAASPHKH